jgi:hypothetical protein
MPFLACATGNVRRHAEHVTARGREHGAGCDRCPLGSDTLLQVLRAFARLALGKNA